MTSFVESIDRVLPSCTFCFEDEVTTLLKTGSEYYHLPECLENSYYLPCYFHLLPAKGNIKEIFAEHLDNRYQYLFIDSLYKNIFCITSGLKTYIEQFRFSRNRKEVFAMNNTSEYIDYFVNLVNNGFLHMYNTSDMSEFRHITSFEEKYHQIGYTDIIQLGRSEYSCTFSVKGDYGRRYFLKQLLYNDIEQENILSNEICIIQKLNNPVFLPRLIYFDVKSLFYVTEYIEGNNLEDYLKNNLLLKEKIRIIKAVVSICSYLHSRNIIHGDLHLGQFIITGDKSLKLTDFDLMVDLSSSNNPPVLGGTFEYLEPESISPDPFNLIYRDNRNIQAEIYRLGVLIYSILYNIPPFYELTWKQLFLAKLNDTLSFAKTDTFGENIPDLLLEVMEKSLNKYPEHRFSFASEISMLLDWD